jgi:dethiobiotin synthetase
MPCRIIFITGTDTGVGKTVLTASLVNHLRAGGSRALAIKPFCSGGSEDVHLLGAIQHHELTPTEISPFYFSQALAPLVAARATRRRVLISEVLKKIQRLAQRAEVLVVEGAGGLLVPLGEGYSLLEVIEATRAEIIVAARNRLGTLNHTLLTLKALRMVKNRRVKVVLMNTQFQDSSSQSNPRMLRELINPVPLVIFPSLGKKNIGPKTILSSHSRLKYCVSRILA